MRYGTDVWSVGEPLIQFEAPRPYGSQKHIRIPAAMNPSLAFFLGAYASEGHTTVQNHCVWISNADEGVLQKLMAVSSEVFGVEPRIARYYAKCPVLVIASKTLADFLHSLGCGTRASNKRIPEIILRATRESMLAYLSGLSLDSYLPTGVVKWAICLDSPGLLDDIQTVLTNLGVVHNRILKFNRVYRKTYGEVYAHGQHAQTLARVIPFVEAHKVRRATEIGSMTIKSSWADAVPGLDGRTVYSWIPRGKSGRYGRATRIRSDYTHLLDSRTRSVSLGTLKNLHTDQRVSFPDRVRVIIESNLHFSRIAALTPALADTSSRPIIPGIGIVSRTNGVLGGASLN